MDLNGKDTYIENQIDLNEKRRYQRKNLNILLMHNISNKIFFLFKIKEAYSLNNNNIWKYISYLCHFSSNFGIFVADSSIEIWSETVKKAKFFLSLFGNYIDG